MQAVTCGCINVSDVRPGGLSQDHWAGAERVPLLPRCTLCLGSHCAKSQHRGTSRLTNVVLFRQCQDAASANRLLALPLPQELLVVPVVPAAAAASQSSAGTR